MALRWRGIEIDISVDVVNAEQQTSPIIDFIPLPAEPPKKRRLAPWPFALMLLGLAAVPIATATEYPEFFAVSLDHLGAAAP